MEHQPPTRLHWKVRPGLNLSISLGSIPYGDYDGFGLFYYKDGVKQDIGCDYDDGTNCWINKSEVFGDTDKITVRRVSENVNLYIGDSLLHSFSNATTEDLYLTLNTGIFNEVEGTLKNYHLEIPELQVNKYCDDSEDSVESYATFEDAVAGLDTPSKVLAYMRSNFTYVFHYGCISYTPEQFFSLSEGDCKDYSTFFSYILSQPAPRTCVAPIDEFFLGKNSNSMFLLISEVS